jgi:hypothetical protein
MGRSVATFPSNFSVSCEFLFLGRKRVRLMLNFLFLILRQVLEYHYRQSIIEFMGLPDYKAVAGVERLFYLAKSTTSLASI